MSNQRVALNLIHYDLQEAWHYLLSMAEQMANFEIANAFEDLHASFDRVHDARLHATDANVVAVMRAVDEAYVQYPRIKSILRSMSFNIRPACLDYRDLLKTAIKVTEHHMATVDSKDQSATVEMR